MEIIPLMEFIFSVPFHKNGIGSMRLDSWVLRSAWLPNSVFIWHRSPKLSEHHRLLETLSTSLSFTDEESDIFSFFIDSDWIRNLHYPYQNTIVYSHFFNKNIVSLFCAVPRLTGSRGREELRSNLDYLLNFQHCYSYW